MKSARDLSPQADYARRLQQFDLREIDAADHRSNFRLKYRRRLGQILNAIHRYVPEGGKILEIGCSQANASLLLAEAGYLAVALDLRAEALQYARSKYERGLFCPVVGSADALPLCANSVDAAILGELLEHCADPQAIIHQAHAVIRKGGILVITTPNGDYLGSDEPLYKSNWAATQQLRQRQFGPAGEHHLFAFSQQGLVNLLSSCGLQILRSGYTGSVVYSDRLSVLKRLLPVRWLELLSFLVNKLPWLNRLLSYTLVAICRKK